MIVDFESTEESGRFVLEGQKEAKINRTGYAVFSGTHVKGYAVPEPYFINITFLLNEEEILDSQSIPITIRNCIIGETIINHSYLI